MSDNMAFSQTLPSQQPQQTQQQQQQLQQQASQHQKWASKSLTDGERLRRAREKTIQAAEMAAGKELPRLREKKVRWTHAQS